MKKTSKTNKTKTWRAAFTNGRTMLISAKCLADALFSAEAWENMHDNKGNLVYGTLDSVKLAW